MPDFGQIQTLRETYDRVMAQRRAANASRMHRGMPYGQRIEEQMENQELFVIMPNVSPNEESVTLGDPLDVNEQSGFHEYLSLFLISY